MMTDSPTPSTSRHHDDKCDKPEKSDKTVLLQIQDINSQVAQFRELLINIGQPRDSPELREKIRKLRRSCVEACKSTSQLVLPHVQSAMDVGIPVDSPNLVLLFYVAQLFLRELYKSKNLIRIVPMDMSGYYEKPVALHNPGSKINRNNGTRRMYRWSNNADRQSSYFPNSFRFFCCAASTNYV